VSVVVCAYTERRWDALVEAVQSVARQIPTAAETIVVVDHNPDLLARAREAFSTATVIANEGARGLSSARNTGVRAASGQVVAFLDDDAAAHDAWLATLAEPFTDAAVIAAGGLAVPDWQSRRPGWLPEEFLWVVGCSYRGLPDTQVAVRNPIGANMAFRREVLLQAGGFADGIGRVGRLPLGCEETELSIRARSLTGGEIRHLPHCRVSHRVTADRTTWRYFRRRCWAEGVSKALVRSSVGPTAALAAERTYVLRTLPGGVGRGLIAFARGERAGLVRAAAIVAGLTLTASGYFWGIARESLPGL
jgi:glycosyltransferase involved in cell wall biosynthesis